MALSPLACSPTAVFHGGTHHHYWCDGRVRSDIKPPSAPPAPVVQPSHTRPRSGWLRRLTPSRCVLAAVAAAALLTPVIAAVVVSFL